VSKLFAVCCLLFATPASASDFVPFVEGEFVIGGALTAVTAATTDKTVSNYGGLALGASCNAHVLSTGIGTVAIAIPTVLVFGSRADAPGIDYQRFHIPLGVMLTIGSLDGKVERGDVAAGITAGYGVMVGAFSTNGADLRPFVNIDLAFGIFERGALKIRYSTTLLTYNQKDGSSVSYNGIYAVASTLW